MKVLLSIAGFDPTSGAGITKDVEIFTSLGFHGIGIPTSIVVQGPKGVRSLYRLPLPLFQEMLKVLEDEKIEIGGLKTGVLVSEEYIQVFSSIIRLGDPNRPFVIDPVLRAKNGRTLLDESGIKSLKERLIPYATCLAPNIEEASILAGTKVETLREAQVCAKRLFDMGAKTVIIKGGHLSGEPIDIFYDGETFLERKRVRFEVTLHGTGCIFSSALLCFLSSGFHPRDAFFEAENVIDTIFKEAYGINENGYMYSSLSLYFGQLAKRFEVINALKRTKEKLEKLNPVDLIPEVQMNICYAIPGARGIEDVCGYPGRISRHRDKIVIKSDPEFGASSHVARTLISFMKFYPQMRSCANIRFKEEFLENSRKNGLKDLSFDRRVEPEEIKKSEGKSLDYLVEEVLKKAEFMPDIIHDRGDFGKEPMIRLFARDPFELLQKMEKLLR